MNLLIDLLPTTVSIDGKEYEIASDFRTFILFELLMQDMEIEPTDKVTKAVELCFDEIPSDVTCAVESILWFYRCGKEHHTQKEKVASKRGNTKVYSFEHDDDLIYAGFMSQYKIDLQDIDSMHWWKFKALFHALTDENEFVKIMGYRSMNITDDMTKGQKAFYKKMKKIHALPLPKNEEEKQVAIEDALLNGGNVEGLL